jgi:phage terminase small subunit|nr:MAG TPA: Terminase small subunit [Caudoviricetes sp.]
MLTPKQKAFADYFLQSGNVTEAARKAGYSEKTAAVIGNENLKKPNVSAYIAERQKQIDDSRIADAAEVQRFYSAVLRGEVKDQFGLEASLDTRMAAGRELMKRHERTEGQNTDAGGIVIVNNIPRE